MFDCPDGSPHWDSHAHNQYQCEGKPHLLLRLVEALGQHVGLQWHVVDAERAHHSLDAIAAEHAENVVLLRTIHRKLVRYRMKNRICVGRKGGSSWFHVE